MGSSLIKEQDLDESLLNGFGGASPMSGVVLRHKNFSRTTATTGSEIPITLFDITGAGYLSRIIFSMSSLNNDTDYRIVKVTIDDEVKFYVKLMRDPAYQNTVTVGFAIGEMYKINRTSTGGYIVGSNGSALNSAISGWDYIYPSTELQTVYCTTSGSTSKGACCETMGAIRFEENLKVELVTFDDNQFTILGEALYTLDEV